MQFGAIPGCGLLLLLVGGSSPISAEGSGCASPPFLAVFSCSWWWVVPRQSWLRALVAVPLHSWQGFSADGGGCFCWCGVGGCALCVFVVCGVCIRVFVVPSVVTLVLRFVWMWRWCPCCLGSCVCASWVSPPQSWLRVVHAVLCYSWLELVAVGGGWSLANPG